MCKRKMTHTHRVIMTGDETKRKNTIYAMCVVYKFTVMSHTHHNHTIDFCTFSSPKEKENANNESKWYDFVFSVYSGLT